MGNILVKLGDGTLAYLSATGSGTTQDPYIYDMNASNTDISSPQIALFLAQALDSGLVLRSAVTSGDETVEITTTGTTPVVGNHLFFKENEFFTQIEIMSVTPIAGDDYDLGLSIPVDHDYTTGAAVILENINMNVDGSSADVEFSISPAGLTAGVEWDITRMIIAMTHPAAGDDGLFGDLAALTNGVYLRIENGTKYNLFNARENAHFAEQGFDTDYEARSGKAGVFATRSRITFNGPDKRGVVFRLSASTSDKYVAIVRDNLSALNGYRTMIQGHINPA
jgi:hypothetical protein